MQLELRDLSSSQSFMVPEEGLTFGRQGGDANVLLSDMGVSKRHARVWGEGGAWFLEDLGSSNGTYVQSERIKEAIEIMPGDVFQMSKVRMEVVQVLGDENRGATGAGAPTFGDMQAADPSDVEPPADEPEPTPKPQPRAPARGGASARPAAAPSKAPAPGKRPAGRPAPASEAPARNESRPPAKKQPVMSAERSTPPSDDDVAGKKGIGYFFVAVPKAIAFYLAAVPLLAVNPVGTIRKSVEEQKHEPKQAMELIAYALPIQLFGAAVNFICLIIVGIVTKSLSIGTIIPIVPLIVAVVVSVITGLVWHPVVKWVVNFLKGESDERSRTNYFLLVQTASGLLAIPSGVAIVLGLVTLPLIGLVPLVLSLAASLMMLFVNFIWFTHFGVVKWFRIVLMVLGGLACLSTLAGLPAAIAGRGSIGSGGVASAGDAEAAVAAAQADAQAQIDAAQKQAEEAAAAAGGDAAERVKAAQEQAKAMQAAAEASAKAGAAQGKDAQARAQKLIEEAKAKAEEARLEAEARAKDAKAKAEDAKTKVSDEKPAPPAAEKVADAAPVAAPAGVASAGTGYPSWRAKYDAIEKRVTDDPTVLKRVSGVESLYKGLTENVYEVESKYQKATSKKPADGRLNNHLRDAELYEKTDKQVHELYGKLFK